MSVSEDRTVQPSPITSAPPSGIADPAPLGLAAFALTTFLLSAANANWASPPYARAKGSHALPVVEVIQPAFLADNRKVVRAKAASPNGPGSAMPETGAGVVGLGWTVRSSLTLKIDPS